MCLTPHSGREISCEETLSTQSTYPQTPPWLPRPYGDRRRAPCAFEPSGERAETAVCMTQVEDSSGASTEPPRRADGPAAEKPARLPAMRGRKTTLSRLKQRAQFLAVARHGRKAVQPGLILQALSRPVQPEQPVPEAPKSTSPSKGAGSIALGFTASRKVGNAVARNRARRRLRALAISVLPLHGKPGYDLVLIARQATVSRAYNDLYSDFVRALRRLGLYCEPAAKAADSEEECQR